MSRIEELLAEHCPGGVRFGKLGEICKIETGKLNANAAVDDGQYSFFTTAKEISKINSYRWDAEALLVAGNANVGDVKYFNGRFEAYQRTYVLTDFTDTIDVRFLFFVISSKLQEYLKDRTNKAAMTYIVLSSLQEFRIPIPPLEVQRAIVEILDTFSKLEAELEAELEARKQQYEHYRAELLAIDEETPLVPLGELAKNLDSKRKPVTRDARIPGNIPYYGASGIVDYVSEHIFDGDYLLVSEDGANLLARSTPIAFSISGKTWVNNHAHVLEFDTYAERRFVELYLNSIDLSPYISGAAQPKLNKANLNRIPIPNPSLANKERIVGTLDKFDALVNDLSVGLPAELAARRQQYEYYRDKLLTFKELEVAS